MRHRIGRRRRAAACAAAAAVIAMFAAAPATRASTIDLIFDTPTGSFPAYDPDGLILQQHAFAARDIWLALLPESGHDYAVKIHYNVLGGNTLGVYNNIDDTIQVRSNTTWYLDPDPTTHDEFGPFTQRLYRDLDPNGTNKASLTGPVPDLLEVGYFVDAPADTPQAAGNDMLSLLLHEMGHFMEIGYDLFAGSVPLQSQFIGNRTGVSSIRDDESHLVMTEALMDPVNSTGRRVLPSAFDLIVAAGQQGHSEIALARVDWIGDVLVPSATVWNHAPGWIGGAEPTASTQVTIRADQHLTVAGTPAVARTLRLIEDSTVTLLDDLTVGLDAEVRGASLFDHPRVDVGAKTFTVGRNLILDLGGINLAGGTLNVGNLLVLSGELSSQNASNAGLVFGHGTVHVGGDLRNRASIRADGGTLTFNADPGVTLDLDGNQENIALGKLRAREGNLEFNAPLRDAFSSIVSVGGGHSLRFTGDWTFDGTSEAFFNDPGDAVFAAKTAGAAINFQGGAVTVDDTHARLQAATIRFAPAPGEGVAVDVLSAATLSLEGAIEYTGDITFALGKLQFVGGGTVRQNGDATVDGRVQMTVGHYDWDGFGVPATNTTITPGSIFAISADDLDGAYGGQVDIGDDALLQVNINSGFELWLLSAAGRIRMGDSSRLFGSQVTVAGKIDALGGSSEFEVPATFTASSIVTITDNATLNLHKPVTYGGGVVTTKTGQPDDSSLAQRDTARVIGHHTITTGYFNWDPANDTTSDTTIESNGHLEVHAKEIGNGVTTPFSLLDRRGFGDTITNNSGRLEVHVGFEEPTLSFPQQWEINKLGELFMNQTDHAPPTVAGSKLVNSGLISGVGVFENRVDNEGIIEVGHVASAGRLQFLDTFAQDEEGLLAFELGGTTPGTLFDQLDLAAGGTLAGGLKVSLLSDYVPMFGDLFRIIEGAPSAQITGTFGQATLPPGQWNVAYGSNFVDLRFIPEPGSAVTALAGVAALMRRRRRSAGPTFSSAR